MPNPQQPPTILIVAQAIHQLGFELISPQHAGMLLGKDLPRQMV